MKLNKFIYLTVFGLTMLFTACEADNEKNPAPYDVGLDNVPSGAYLKTISSSTPINLFDIPNSSFSVTLEHNDNADGALLQDVNVFLSFTDNTFEDDADDISVAESLYATIPASAFSSDDRPLITYTDPTPGALAFLGITEDDLDGTDVLQYRFELNLTNGTSFTNTNTNPNIIGEPAFASPFVYNASVVCPVAADFLVGEYTLETTQRGIFDSTVFVQGATTISVGEAEDQRTFTSASYPDLGAFGDQPFTFSLICGSVVVPSGQGTGAACVASITRGPSIVGTYDIEDDSTITINFTDDETADCGVAVMAQIILTKN